MESIKQIKNKIVFIFFGLIVIMCTAQKKVAYEFPDAMLPHVKVQYIEQCDKGQVLYKLSCAKCHTTRVKRREIIPDFKEEQLRGYELRITNAKHTTSLPDSLVSEEELGLIMTFLRYKKRNN